MNRELTGRHVLAIALTAFGVIIAANMTMLFSATGSFPGLVVKNAYVASQGWNARTAAQKALGWELSADYAEGMIEIALNDRAGVPVTAGGLTAVLGRPTTDAEDRPLALNFEEGVYRATADLRPGAWQILVRVDGETPFQQTVSLFITGAR